MLFFGNKCCFFIQISIFIWINVQNPEKSIFVAEKQHFLLKMSNNDAMLLPASNIASWAHVDDSNQHSSTILRFSKDLDIWQILKIDFEHHIYCHVYDLSNITNWQHTGGDLYGNKSAKNLCLPTAPEFNSHLWCWFFQVLIKSTIFGSKNNKCCF